MRIERIWAMPSDETFKIKPIANLLTEEISDISWNFRRIPPYGEDNLVKIKRIWIDPFCGKNSPATITNDLNTSIKADYHLDAVKFLKLFEKESVDGVLYDPPYSPRQISECFHSIGLDTQGGIKTRATFWSDAKNEIARIVKPGGKVICCGWNSMGIGINRGFDMTRILLVPHGGNHNDTIVTVEIKRDTSGKLAFAGIPLDKLELKSV
jgi:hypothetical protein